MNYRSRMRSAICRKPTVHELSDNVTRKEGREERKGEEGEGERERERERTKS
jgi:hypothetical protein